MFQISDKDIQSLLKNVCLQKKTKYEGSNDVYTEHSYCMPVQNGMMDASYENDDVISGPIFIKI